MTNPHVRNAGLDDANMNDYYSISEPVTHDTYSIIEHFHQAMNSAGIFYAGEIIADGKLRRFHIEGQKSYTKNGAYVLHLDDCPAGWFMDYKSGFSQTWKSSGGTSHVSRGFAKQIKEARLQREAEVRQKHKEAANKAFYIWSQSKPTIQQTEHAYLMKKGIQPHGARLYRNALVIPIYNESDQLINLQFISSEGEKRFLSGGRKKGCFHIIGKLTKRILICEGFATGASLYEDSNQRVVIAFDAGNLLPVAKNIRELSPDFEIIICGDNDLSGIGQQKAQEAALSIGGKVLIPSKPETDWNDVLTGGIQNG